MNWNMVTRVKAFSSICLFGVIVGCGGQSVSVTSAVQTFTAAMNSALSSLASTPSGFSAFTSLLDSTYKQDGLTNADLVAMLTADAAAIPADASFPVVSYSNPVISNCTTAKICDLIVTAFNADADLTSTTLTLKVIDTGSGYKLVGDQSSS